MKKILFLIIVILSIILIFNLNAANKKNNKYDRVTIYTTLDEPVAVEVFKQFTKDTGIKADWVRLSTGECQARLEAEKENPQASVWFGGVGILHIGAKNEGLTTPYISPNTKNIPDNFKDKNGYWTGIYAGMLCFESNTNMLKKYNLKAPTSWEEICDPKYKGHVQMANPGSSGTSYNVVATLILLFGEDKAFDLLKKLDANIIQYTRSGSAPGKNAAIGETTIAIGYSHDAVKLISDGYPLQITFPKEGTGYEVASVSMIKNGPAKEVGNAKKLIDWGLDRSCAKVFAKMKLVPFVDVPLSSGAVSIKKVKTIKQDDEWAAKEKSRLVEKWNNIIGGESKTK
jgi:iron(III) transport system substrate-binding protein